MFDPDDADIVTCHCSPIFGQEIERIDLDARGDPLHGLQRQVPLAAFNPAHVGAVDAEDVGEGFLAEATLFAVAAEVATQRLLQVAFHALKPEILLLEGLHTYK